MPLLAQAVLKFVVRQMIQIPTVPRTTPLLRTVIPALLLLLLAAPATRADIGYQFVPVGNPGNANDTVAAGNGGLSYGAVSYSYAIGQYDVTLTQYTAFLNAVANADPFGLYNPSMATDLNVAGILQSGSSGNFSYSVIGSGNRPVTYVSELDAMRFSNWLGNGQPLGLGEVAASTEDGAYTMASANQGFVLRNANAQYWVPTENEWYKAAYYDPNKGGPGVGGYWTYATRSDNALGNVIGNAPNQANFVISGFSVGQSWPYSTSQNYLTDVGAFSGSASAYGTYDQNGDVNQIIGDPNGGYVERRGGSWGSPGADQLTSSTRFDSYPSEERREVGFRIATVPEPGAGASLILAGAVLLARRRRAALPKGGHRVETQRRSAT